MLKNFCVVLLLLLVSSSWAQAADERFAVEINVDVTDANAAAARQRAMNEANRAAVAAVARRITTQAGAEKLAAMTDEQLVNFIKEVSVIDEKRSLVRYMASLRVVLNEDILVEYMKERNIPVMVQSGGQILVVPIFREFSSDAPLLWESANMWKQAWDQAPQTGSVRLVSLPATGDNYAAMDAHKAMTMDSAALDRLMRLNNAEDVYVLDAVYDGIDGLLVHAVSSSGDNRTIKVAGARSSGMELFAKAVEEVRAELENRIMQQNITESAQEDAIVSIYEFARLQDWVAVEKAIKTLPNVKHLDVQALGAGQVQFKLFYGGSFDKLQQALHGRSLRLVEQDNFYTLEKY